MANQTKLGTKPNQMNTIPTPEDEQIMNDILIQIKMNERKSKVTYNSAIDEFSQKQMKL
jgi:hypothetical protein